VSQALAAEPIGLAEKRGGARLPTFCFEFAPTIMLALSHFAAPKNQLYYCVSPGSGAGGQ